MIEDKNRSLFIPIRHCHGHVRAKVVSAIELMLMTYSTSIPQTIVYGLMAVEILLPHVAAHNRVRKVTAEI